jgi:hypothetical protein
MEALLPTLIKLFGPTLARVLLAVLLKDRVELEAIGSGDIAETLADSLNIGGLVDHVTGGDWQARRNSERLFEKIGDEAAEKLVELFRHENVAISEVEREAVLEAAQETMNRRAMPLLIKARLDPHSFRRALSDEPPGVAFGTTAQYNLYKQLLETCAQLVFAIADKLPHFTRDTTALLLQNEDRLLSEMQTALTFQERILAETYGRQQAREAQVFEGEYRSILANELDQLSLFGVQLFDGAKQPLSVAFIKLKVSLLKPELDSPDELVETLIQVRHQLKYTMSESVGAEQALTQGSRLLVVAGAGSGKSTRLKWAAVQAARDVPDPALQAWRGRIPFFVRLRDFARRPLPAFGPR